MNEKNERKQYEEPEIIFETELETRAGSTLNLWDAFDWEDDVEW